MGKSIIVTEKSSVADEFAKVLGVAEKHTGYMENGQYIITWCRGHLVTMSYPEKYDLKLKKWSLDTLPFLPSDYKYEVIASAKEQFKVVKSLYNRNDITRIYYAGDAGREGLYIQMLVRQMAGRNKDAEEKVIWLDSQTEEEIKRGIREAKDLSEYELLSQAGYMRAIEDFAVGINFSRAISLKYANLLNSAADLKTYTPISVGRVMSCVLGMVVMREYDIVNFKPTSYYKIRNTITVDGVSIAAEWQVSDTSKMKDSPLLYKENGFKEEKDAKEFMESLPKEVIISNINRAIEKKSAPALFNLAELQGECTNLFKISPDETLACVQSLYEKKLTTYPRTDSRVLSSAVAKEITHNLNGLKAYNKENIAAFCDEILEKQWYKNLSVKYVDDTKVTDHYAIIPTGEGFNAVPELTDTEEKVYQLICKRFLSIFYPPAQYYKVKMVENANGEEFFCNAKYLHSPGYLQVTGTLYEDEEKKNMAMLISQMKKNSEHSSEYAITHGKTSAPKRYNSGSLILALENAGQLIEDEDLRAQIKSSGIGTSATRAEILKKLVKLSYLSLNKKTQVVTPATMGFMVFEVLRLTAPELLNPKMTASWEKGLSGIEKGTVAYGDYREKLESYVRQGCEKVKREDISEDIKQRILPFAKNKNLSANTQRMEIKETDIKCPCCGKILLDTGKFYSCSGYKKDGSGCNFIVSGEIGGKKITVSILKTVTENGRTDVMNDFVSQKGNLFPAYLALENGKDKNGQERLGVTMKFPEPVESKIGCPKCGHTLKKDVWKYKCDCGYEIYHNVCGKALSENIMEELVTKGSTSKFITGFVSKKGKPFPAKLYADENGNIKMEYQQRRK